LQFLRSPLAISLAGSLVAMSFGLAQSSSAQDFAALLPFVASDDAGAPLAVDEVSLPIHRSPYDPPATDLEARIQQLEDVIHQQARRQQVLEQQLFEPTSINSTYLVPDFHIPSKGTPSEPDAAAAKKAEEAKKPSQKWSGRIHADHWAFPNTSPGANAFETGSAGDSVDDRFLFRRLRLGLQGDIPDNMLYKLEVDFNNPNNPQLKDNYLGWEELPWLQTVLVGNQKRPYGLDHLNSSRYNVFIERPFIVEAFNQDARRFGICSYGVSENEAWNWRYGAYMSQDIQNLGTVLATPVLEDYQAELAGRLANTFWYDEASHGRGYGHWAVSGTVASTDGSAGSSSTARFQTRPEGRTASRWLDTDVILGADDYQLLGLEGVLNLGAVQLVGEYQNVWMQRTADPDLHFGGGYVYLSYFLTGEHMPWDRESGTLERVVPFENFFSVRTCDDGIATGWGAWQVAVRYSYADLSDDNVLGGVGNNLTCGLNWYWNPYAKMQFNYIYGDIDDRRPADGQTSGTYSILGTRFMVDF